MPTKKITIILLVIVLLGAVVLGVFMLPTLQKKLGEFFGGGKGILQEEGTIKETGAGVPEEKVPEPKLNKNEITIPDEVYSYQGEVMSKSSNGFTLAVSAQVNYVEEDQIMEVRVDKKTKITRFSLGAPSRDGKPQITTEIITFDDIVVNDIVNITTSQNIKEKTSFRAETVRVMKLE